MIKFITFILSAIFLLATPRPAQDKEEFVTVSAPQFAKPGTDFTVTLTIKSRGLSGVARLQQYLPSGFTATPLSLESAQFIQQEDGIKFLWTEIPSNREITISYNIHVDDTLNGLKVINGSFIYLTDGKTTKSYLNPTEINIGIKENSPQISRKLLMLDADKGMYRVELTIRPDMSKVSARFVDDIPQGYTVQEEETHGASFIFDNSQAVFSWEGFENNSPFTVSYIVKGPVGKTPVIQGMYVYGESDSKEDSLADAIIDEMIKNENENNSALNSTTEESSEISEEQESTDPYKDILPAIIYYKIQIAATKKSPERNQQFFIKNYKISDPVEKVTDEGWRKYMVGTFTQYSEASNEKIKTREIIEDAFIVAYKGNQRITVAEAKKNALAQ